MLRGLVRVGMVVAAAACAAPAPERPRTDPVVIPTVPAPSRAAAPLAPPSASVPEAPAEPPSVCAPKCSGTTTPELVEALRLRATSTRSCYERELVKEPKLEGRLLVEVKVGAGGETCDVRMVESTLGDRPRLFDCVAERFDARYPPPEGGCVLTRVPLSYVVQDAGATP